MKYICLLIVALALTACASGGNKPAAPPNPSVGVNSPGDTPWPGAVPIAAEQPAGPGSVQRPASKEFEIIHVYMYQITVPYGTFIHNNDFWKLVEEDAVDVPTYDLLLRNGLRIGRGQARDFPKFGAIIDKEAYIFRTTQFFNVSGGGNNMLNVNPEDPAQEIAEETLFVFDQHLTGRSYAHCQNRLLLSFLWEPHTADTVRVTICPTVEVLRSRPDWWLTDYPRENPALHSEHLYDLGLRTDIGPDGFVVLGASPQADDPYRVGNAFLTHDLPTMRTEQLLILTRKPLPLQHARTEAGPTTRQFQLTPPAPKK